MKIMAGMGCIDDYMEYVKAGADEIFIGYVPGRWNRKHGNFRPLNRREVIFYNVQIGSASELMILKEMMSDYKVPVTITFNSLHYEKEDYQEILSIMEECYAMGFTRFIVADGDFLEYLDGQNLTSRYDMILSGEYGELNEGILPYWQEKKIKRIIFPRQTTIREMKELISKAPSLEYEAFVLNERCQFTGAYCNSMHCDEICHMCQVPYRLRNSFSSEADYQEVPPEELPLRWDVPGASGCGLCALWNLKEAGITHLKLVSRGNGSEETRQDLQSLKQALSILDESHNQEEYIRNMKAEIFPSGCSYNCYYRLKD